MLLAQLTMYKAIVCQKIKKHRSSSVTLLQWHLAAKISITLSHFSVNIENKSVWIFIYLWSMPQVATPVTAGVAAFLFMRVFLFLI